MLRQGVVLFAMKKFKYLCTKIMMNEFHMNRFLLDYYIHIIEIYYIEI